jgi:hypothetical protein
MEAPSNMHIFPLPAEALLQLAEMPETSIISTKIGSEALA